MKCRRTGWSTLINARTLNVKKKIYKIQNGARGSVNVLSGQIKWKKQIQLNTIESRYKGPRNPSITEAICKLETLFFSVLALQDKRCWPFEIR